MSSNTNIGNTPVNQGYVQLIHTGETGGIDGTLRTLYDGDGTASDLQIASNKVKISTELYIGSKTITEYVQDVVGDMLDTNGSHTNITATYDDNGDGAIDLVATGAISGLTEGTGVTITGTANKTIAIGQSVGTSDSVTFGRVNLGSTDTSSFLTGDPKISATGYMMIQGIINETETGSAPAAIVFGNNSTYGNDEISLITNGQNRLFINSSGDIAISQDLTISGDLQVNGTTTTVNQTNLDVSDNIIGLNRGVASNANDSGLIIERGSTGDNAAILWDETASKFTLGTTTATPSDTGDITVATGTLVAALEGNATTATGLANGRTISLTGDVTGTSGSFDGTGNVSIAATIAANSVALGTDTTGNYVGTITASSGLSSTGATSGEGIAHSISVNAGQVGITSIYNSSLKIGTASDGQIIDFNTSDEIRLGSSTQATVKIKTDPLGSAQDEVIIGDGSYDVDFVVDGSGGSTIFKVDAGTGNTAVTGDLSVSGSFSPATVTASTSVRTPLIEFTDGDDAITIADGGAMTFAKGFAVTSGASSFGANVAIKNTGGTTLQLNTSTTDVDINGLLGRINFSAPDESAGSDSNLLAASIVAQATADFTASSNKTDMIFQLGVSETASEKFRIVSDGKIKIGGSYTLPSSDGSANQVLKTNGSGTVSFADESAGAVSAVANGSNNRIATFSSSDALNGEANLTFDSSTLALTGDQTISGVLKHSSNGDNRLTLDDDSDSSNANQVTLASVNNVNILIDGSNNGTGDFQIRSRPTTANDLDTADIIVDIDETTAIFDNITSQQFKIGGALRTRVLESGLKVENGSLGVGQNPPSVNGSAHISNLLRVGTAGEVALTVNDGGGNANVTFNHTSKVPDRDGNSGRIEVNVDSSGGEYMAFELAGNVTSGVTVATDEKFRINSTGAQITGQLNINQTNALAPIYLRDSRASYNAEISQRSDGRISLATRAGTYGSNGSIEILDSGNVGIGTNSPESKLNIVDSGETIIRLYASTASTRSGIWFTNGSYSYGTNIGTDNKFHITGNINSEAELVTVDSSGNVGIGTTAPLSKLHIEETTNDADALMIRQVAGGSGSVQGKVHIGMNHFNTTNPSVRISAIENTVADYRGHLAFSTRESSSDAVPTEKMRITYNGKVGIGETNPAFGLQIDGSNFGGDSFKITRGTSAFTILQANNSYGVLGMSSNHDLQIRTNATTRMTVEAGGDVGIGVSPTSRLHVKDATDISMDASANGQVRVEGNGYALGIALNASGAFIYQNSSARFMAFGNNETEQVRLTTAGALHVDNDVVAFSTTPSDIKLKTNIKDIEYGLDTIMKLNPKQYDWKEDNRHDIGFIAQEVEEVIPEIVKDNEWFDDKIKTLDYEKLTAVLIKAVQEQQQQINELKEKLNG